MSQLPFSSLALDPSLLQNLASLDYHKMTPIQAQSLPYILEGKDVIGQAKTGSGKTAAFALGVLQALDVKAFRVQSLILCPTRELSDQVAKELRKLARTIHNIKVLTLCGGMPFGPQVGSLKHGAHIIVGTPGRIEEHLRKGHLDLSNLNIFVLDEADRMLDMGFADSLDNIISHIPAKRQTLLFSATFPESITAMSQRVANNPIHVKAESKQEESLIEQQFYCIDDTDRFTALCLLLLKYSPERTVVFCNTKRETETLTAELKSAGFSALALNGDLEQKHRDKALVRFSNKSISILVATDVAARGLDIDALEFVVNYQIARDLQVHVHRVGRTGRAENKGIACTLFNSKETFKKTKLEEYLGYEIAVKSLPDNSSLDNKVFRPSMKTLEISAGKKQKIRPGDIVGALTAKDELTFDQIGKIQVTDFLSYVAVDAKIAGTALKKLEQGKLKGRSCKVRQL